MSCIFHDAYLRAASAGKGFAINDVI